MYKVKIKHLEKVRKTLEDNNNLISPETKTGTVANQIKENEKAIKLINDEYLEIKS